MKANECMKVLAKHRGDAVVVCALGMAANEWWAVTKSEDSFYMHGGMGLGARPSRSGSRSPSRRRRSG